MKQSTKETQVGPQWDQPQTAIGRLEGAVIKF